MGPTVYSFAIEKGVPVESGRIGKTNKNANFKIALEAAIGKMVVGDSILVPFAYSHTKTTTSHRQLVRAVIDKAFPNWIFQVAKVGDDTRIWRLE